MTVHFIGAGPGAADLITLRGARLLGECPVCLYAGSIVSPDLLAHCWPGARLVDTAPHPVRWFVVEASAITDLDYSAGRSVNLLCKELAARGIKVIFARVNRYLRADMDRHGVTSVIGAGNIHETLHGALAGAQDAAQPPSPAHA